MKPTTKWIITVILLQSFVVFGYSQAPENPPKSDVIQIFPGTKSRKDFKFHFSGHYKEKSIKASDGVTLNALLFKTDSAKGVIFYLHGNTGDLTKWGKIAKVYTDLHYDLFMIDYRGYGKSEGSIKNEKQLYSDLQTAYDSVRSIYLENKIIILGYSIGTGSAAMLAAYNHPGKLILQAPYYSLADAINHLAPSIDTTGLPFFFKTYHFLPKVACPIIIFHGDSDKEFYYGSSEKLKVFFKPGDELVILRGAGHTKMEENKEYLESLKRVL